MRFAGPGEVSGWARHKLSAIWGDPDEDIISGIADRMREGDVVPAVALVDNREIVDGWHRVRAARIAGVGLYVEDLTELDDLAGRVLAGNMLRRRHSAIETTRLGILTLEASGWRLYAHGQTESGQVGDSCEKYLKNEDIAKLCGVGERTITRARRLIDYERKPTLRAERERRLESKRLQREEEEQEYQKAVQAQERERALQDEELKTMRAKVAAYEIADLEDTPDFDELDDVVVDRIEEIINPVAKRNEELLAERDKAWAEVDRLKTEVDLLHKRVEHLQLVNKNWKEWAKRHSVEQGIGVGW